MVCVDAGVARISERLVMSEDTIQVLEAVFGAMWLIAAMVLVLGPPIFSFVEWDMRRTSARERAKVQAAMLRGERRAAVELDRIRRKVDDEYAHRRG